MKRILYQTVAMIALCCSIVGGVCLANGKSPLSAAYAEIDERFKELSPIQRDYFQKRLEWRKPVPLLLQKLLWDEPLAAPPVRIGAIGVPSSATPKYAVSQVIDKDNMLIFGYNFWLEGVSTVGLTDGKNGSTISLSDTVVQYVGTKRYNTRAGSKTVYHLVVVDARDAEKLLADFIELEYFHNWTDPNGEFLLAAKFIKSQNGQYYLKRFKDYKIIKVARTDVSSKDRKWIKTELKRRREEKKLESVKKRRERPKKHKRR